MSDTAENPRQNVTFGSNGGEAHGYLARPASGRGPGVIVIQEWWGLTDHIAEVADRLAAEGFVALAPDLFGGRTAHDADEADRLMSELPEDQAARDLAGAVDHLLASEDVEGESVACVGFCMGGGFVLSLAVQQGERIAAAIPYYGVGHVPQDFTGLRAAVQGHYGLKDDFYPVEQARALEQQIREQAGVEVEFHYYDAAHAFHNDTDKLGTYSPEDARLAWQRTVAFLRAHVR